MVVSGAGAYYTSNFDYVSIYEVTGALVLTMNIKSGAILLDTLVETYYPDSKGVVKVRGLGRLAEDYIERVDITSSRNDCELVAAMHPLTVEAVNVSTTLFTCSFYLSKDRTDITPLDNMLFMARYKEKKVRAEQHNWLFWYQNTYSVVPAVAYISNGVLNYTRLSAMSNTDSAWWLMSFTANGVLAKLNSEKSLSVKMVDVAYIDMYLVKTSDSSLLDRSRYYVDQDYYPFVQFIEFYNLFGYPDSLYITGKDSYKTELNAEFAQSDDEYRKIYDLPVDSHESNVGYIASEYRDSIRDLIRSEKVYISNNDTDRREITITEVTLDSERPKSGPDNYKITWRAASDRAESFSRSQLSTASVFDTSFDETYE